MSVGAPVVRDCATTTCLPVTAPTLRTGAPVVSEPTTMV